MINILRYALSGLILAGYLIWLTVVLLHHPSDDKILRTVNAAPLVLMFSSLLLPQGKSRLRSVIWILGLLTGISWGWFYFRLVPPERHDPILFGFACALIIGFVYWFCEFSYRKWWPKLSPKARLIAGTAAVIALAIIFAISVISAVTYMGITWHGIISNWGLTLVIIYLPIFLGALWLARKLESRKIKGKE